MLQKGGRRKVTTTTGLVANSGGFVTSPAFDAQNGTWAVCRPEERYHLKKKHPAKGVSEGQSACLTDNQGQPDEEWPEDEVQDPGAESQGSQHGQPEHDLLHHDLPGCFTGVNGHFHLPFGNRNNRVSPLFCLIQPSRQC